VTDQYKWTEFYHLTGRSEENESKTTIVGNMESTSSLFTTRSDVISSTATGFNYGISKRR